jgi:hypothetical protein
MRVRYGGKKSELTENTFNKRCMRILCHNLYETLQQWQRSQPVTLTEEISVWLDTKIISAELFEEIQSVAELWPCICDIRSGWMKANRNRENKATFEI